MSQAWATVVPSTEFVPSWHIDCICEHLEAVTSGQILKLIINIPPRMMKSTLVSVMWPAWEWIDHPHLDYISASHAISLSLRDNVTSRWLIASPWYRQNWGDRYRLTSDQNEKGRYANDKGGERIAVSVGGGGMGEGGDRRLIDDPHDTDQSLNKNALKTVADWWDLKFRSRVNDPRRSATVVIMQRVAEDDLSGHLLQEGGWEHLVIQGQYEGGRKGSTSIPWVDPRTREGESICEARFSEAEYDSIRKHLPYVYASQVQQRPAPLEGAILKRQWWRYWHPRGMEMPPVLMRMADAGEYEEIPSTPLPRILTMQLQSWDMAFKASDDSAYVAGQVWGRCGADKYLLDQERGKWDFVATLDAVRRLTDRCPDATTRLVEDKANGPAVISSLRHEISGLIPVQPEGDKTARASAVTPDIQAGNVYLPHPELFQWVRELIEECATFPRGRYADQVDALTQALRWYQRRSVAVAYEAVKI